jgi:hypothetical protein
MLNIAGAPLQQLLFGRSATPETGDTTETCIWIQTLRLSAAPARDVTADLLRIDR